MSLDKRPRSSYDYTPDDSVINLISDDEDFRPRKRQKSVTPSRATEVRPFARQIVSRSTSIRSTPDPISEPNGVSGVTNNAAARKKTSPWRNQPSWQKQVLTTKSIPNVLKPSAKHFNDRSSQILSNITRKELNGWTVDDNDRLRELSLGQEGRGSSSQSSRNGTKVAHIPHSSVSHDHEEEREQIIEKFKLGPTTALRFNPNDGTTPLPPAHKHYNRHSDGARGDHARLQTSLTNRKPLQPLFQEGSSDPQSTTKRKNKTFVNLPSQLTTPKNLAAKALTSSLTTEQTDFSLPPSTPNQTPKLSVNVPISDSAKLRKERKVLIEKLKGGTEYAKAHPKEIERYLGLTGFSAEFQPAKDKRFENAGQPKKRKVNRSQVLLDMGGKANPEAASRSDIPFTYPADQAKAILTARFAEPFQAPLTFSNNVNDRRLNGKFQFISEYILRKGVKVNGPIGQPGCNCHGQCNMTSICACLKKTFKAKDSKLEWSEQIQQYERRPDGLVVLRDDFIKRHMICAPDDSDDGLTHDPPQRVEISECNEYCGCDNSCINRVVQKGRAVPLEIFETERCGFGVRSSTNLVRGQFIEFYLGEVITDGELKRREDAAEAGSTSYIYSLDWFSSHQPYHIDGENFGSAMRFVNHSCDPNAGTFPVLNNKSTKQLHYVAFFALKDIPAGTEITIDYTPQAVGTTYELKAADQGMERCYCGAKNCRQMLWLPGKERKARKKIINKDLD